MKYTALILILSVFVVMGCSSGDDQDKGAEVVGPTGPTVSKGPQKIYISAGKDELDSEKLPDYLKTDLGEPAEVTVETAGSKWKIVVGEKIYEAQYHDFASDAEGAAAKFKAFVTDFNAGDAAVVIDGHLSGSSVLYIDGEKFKKKYVQKKFQELINPIGGGEQWKTPVALQESYVSGTLGLFQAWLHVSNGLGNRGKTWVYLEKDDANSEWKIKELHTGDEENPEIYWKNRKEYKIF